MAEQSENPEISIVTEPWPDDGALQALWLRVWGEPGPASFRPILERGLTHVGAFDGAVLIGFVNVAWDGGQHGFILDTSVDPHYRRQGIASQLVAEAVAVARSRGLVWLHVDFEPQHEGFYRGCGFVPTAAGLMRLK